jgi:hypothetical protein
MECYTLLVYHNTSTSETCRRIGSVASPHLVVIDDVARAFVPDLDAEFIHSSSAAHLPVNRRQHETVLIVLINRATFRSGRRDSNSRQLAWKARALPTELLPHQSGRPDLNRRPHGPKPCALPDCATPRSTPVILKMRNSSNAR